MKTYIVLVLMMLHLVSCQYRSSNTFKPREGSVDVQTIDLYSVPQALVDLDTMVYDVKYIVPEASEGSYLSDYEKIITKGDTIFILNKGSNQEAIFAFNMQGDYLFKIDRRGRGPGEYLDISDFYVDVKQKEIGILTLSQILKYGFDGAFKEKLNLRRHFVLNVIQQDTLLYCRTGPLGYKQSPFSVAVFNTNGKLIYKDYPLPDDIMNYRYGKRNYLASNRQNSFVNMLNCDTIYQFTDKHLTPKYVLDFGNYKLPPNELNKLLKRGALDFDYRYSLFSNHDYAKFGLYSFIINDEYLFMHYDVNNSLKTVIYSLKTGETVQLKPDLPSPPSDKYLASFGFEKFNEKEFYGVMSINEALHYKFRDEKDMSEGAIINDPERLKRIELLKTIDENSNPIIVVYKLKDIF